MKLLIKDKLHIYDVSDSIKEFDLEINNINFSYLKNSIREKANIVICYENFSEEYIKDINPDKSLFIKNDSPKFVFVSARNKKKILQNTSGLGFDYQEICQFFTL